VERSLSYLYSLHFMNCVRDLYPIDSDLLGSVCVDTFQGPILVEIPETCQVQYGQKCRLALKWTSKRVPKAKQCSFLLLRETV